MLKRTNWKKIFCFKFYILNYLSYLSTRFWRKAPCRRHISDWKVGRVNDRAGLEIRYTLSGIGGLNPSPSAKGASLSAFNTKENPTGSLF